MKQFVRLVSIFVIFVVQVYGGSTSYPTQHVKVNWRFSIDFIPMCAESCFQAQISVPFKHGTPIL